MKDFKEFSNSSQKENYEGKFSQGVLNLIKSVTKNLQGKNENEVMSAIVNEAKQRKAQGTLSNADLDVFYSALYPMLNDKRRERLKEVIAKIKSI